MAINSLGYRKWHGRLAPTWTRTVVIARTGIRRAWGSRWLRRMLFFAWLPALWFALGFFFYEKSLEYPQFAEPLTTYLHSRADSPQLESVLRLVESDDPSQARHGVWAWLLLCFLRYPQGVVMALVVGLIAPPLISQDIRSRAFLLYFSRPIGRYEYVLGKLAIVWAYLGMISLAPALALYIGGILLSPDATVIAATWDLPLRIMLATCVLSIPTASLALCISSLTQESRYAAFAWFAIWVMGWVTYGLLSAVDGINQVASQGTLPAGKSSIWANFSLYHTLGRVQSWVFGFAEFKDIRVSSLILIALTIASLWVLSRRVASPLSA